MEKIPCTEADIRLADQDNSRLLWNKGTEVVLLCSEDPATGLKLAKRLKHVIKHAAEEM
jgi:hypothetical protein